MNSPAHVSCALCSKPALLFASPNYGRYSAVRCTSCGDFVISHTAAERVAGLPSEFADAWRARIRAAKPEEIFLLIVEPVGAGGGLKGELVLRSGLSL